jgi:hypothetical protein
MRPRRPFDESRAGSRRTWEVQASGFEPELLAWKAKILTRLDHACPGT